MSDKALIQVAHEAREEHHVPKGGVEEVYFEWGFVAGYELRSSEAKKRSEPEVVLGFDEGAIEILQDQRDQLRAELSAARRALLFAHENGYLFTQAEDQDGFLRDEIAKAEAAEEGR